jgi:hypothetical protein
MQTEPLLSSFNECLAAARAQPEAQRLLFVFGVAELPATYSPGQEKRFREGRGGALSPVMCVDKAIAELADFSALVHESRSVGQPWDVVFAAALAGPAGREPTGAEVEQALRSMIGAVHRGAVERFLAFDADGQSLRLS